jgi:hypothetical protein
MRLRVPFIESKPFVTIHVGRTVAAMAPKKRPGWAETIDAWHR